MPSKRKVRRRKNKEEEVKPKLKEKVTELLELPKEVVLNIPKFTMIGSGELIIENYKGVIEYEDEKVRVNTNSGVIKITGEKLVIREITSENIFLNGKIKSLEFFT
jgi:sporulation protein YqfC